MSKCICSLGRGVHSVHKFVHFGSEHCWSDVGGSEFSSNTVSAFVDFINYRTNQPSGFIRVVNIFCIC